MKKHFNDGTFRGTKHMVKAIAFALCFVLLFTSFDTAVFAAEDVEVFESEIELVEESDDIEEQPVEYAETEEPIDDQMILESLPLEVEEVPFEQSITVDDVVITVSADAGVFPEGASMSARKVTISEENEVAEAIDEVRDNDKKVALSYTFDITVCDMDGNEIEPDTEKGSVKVTFKMTEIANINLETEVYHLEETDGGLNVENLDVKSDEGGADEVAVETTGFSFYSVEFTYNELQYVLEGDEKVELTTILDAVGIKENGEISKVEGSDDELVKPVFDDDENVWYIESVKAFNTEEWLKVTIDGIEYEIVVTDNQTPGEWSKLLDALNGTITTTVAGQFEIDGSKITLLADFTAGDGATTLTVSGAKKLDLNGHVINANGKSMRVLTIPSGAELTLEDSDTTASHEGYIDADDIWHLGTGTGTSQAIAGGIITGGKVASDNSGGISDGGGVLVKGTLKMYGGSISGNTISYTNYGCGGGGIAVTDNGIFEMYGGHITYNKAGNGGGVFVENATFNMYGGVIEKCKAESGQYGNGGGIFTHTNSTFTMTGGAIKNNTAAGNGAGVHNNSGTVTLGGKALITNNRRGTDYNNLYLPSNHTVYISTTTSPTTGMSVHVTLENGTGKVTNTSGTDQYAQYFGSDKLSNGVVAKDGFVQIVSKTNIVASVNHNDQYIYYDSLQNAINAAGTEDEVQLFRDIQEDISVSTDKNITLDLNGKVLKGTGAKSTITVRSGASLTLCDSRADVVHYYKYNSNGAWTWDDSAIGDAITVEEISDSTATGTPIILKGGAITGGSGTVFSGKSYGGGLYNYGTLTMDGGNIVGNSVSWYGGGIYSIGTFELNGGNIVGNYTEVHGAGVYINDTASEFVMSGGQIIYNASKDQAGGVYLQKGNFGLKGGSISHNQALNLGGGVICSGTMKMYGGEISFNKAVGTDRFGYGGGLHNVADMYLYDGNISHNSARYGAGIYNGYDEVYGEHYVSPGYLTMTGGTVSENDCSLDGGGLYYRNGDITLGKKAQVSGNKKGTGQDASEQNIYLPSGTQIEVADGDDVPTSGMKIGVTLASGTGCFTTDTATEECEKYFFADESEKSVVFDPSKKQLQIVNGQAQVHDGIVFIAWTEANSLPNTAGNYYLTEEVTLSSPWTVPVGTINLCLNGHVIKQGTDGNRVIYVPPTATLNIYDCSSKKHYFTRNSESDPWVLAEDQTTPTEFSVEGGVITGGVIKVIESGAGIYVDGTFSMYGGNIAGNNITNSTADKVFGAGVFVQNSGVFNMRGGSIVGNACKANAGGVAVGTNGNRTGKFNMYGGTISDNYAYLWGGGVNNWGTIVMESGTITNNVAKTFGGGGVSNAASFTMTGGTIKDNNACTVGGGVVGDGTVTIGGTAVITNNYVNNLADNLSLGGSMNFASGENVPTTGMSVGINTRKTSYPATISVASNTDYSQYLTSDNDAHCIYYKSSDKMLYLANPATLTIDLNGGIYPEGSSAVADWEYDSINKTYSKKGSKVTLPDAPAAPTFTKFNGWKYNSNLYDAGTEIVFESTENRTYTAEYVNIGSSIKTFATPGELTDPDFFSLWKNAGGTPKGIAQKVYFGGMPWYIVGKDSADGSLVLMSVEGNFGSSAFGSNSTYSTSTIRNYLNTTAMDKFTTAEKALMQGLTSVGGDKLYLGTGEYMQAGVAVGSNSNNYVSMLNAYATQGSPYTSGGWFWLRIPYDAANMLIGFPGGNPEVGGGIHYWGVTNSLWILPAMNLNLSSVLCASSAPVASASTTFDDGMNFRIVAGNKISSSAMYTESKVSVTKGEDAGDLYLYVQGKDTTSDWVWSTKITESSSYDVSDIHDGVDLSECVIWLETLNKDDRLAYAKEASATSPYTVTLNNNGGTGGIESVEATLYSDMPEVSTLPTKDGAIFIGYFDEETGGTRYYNADGSSAKKWDKFSDATLYAHWHEHSWTILAGTGTDSNVLYAVCSEPECEYYGTTEDVTNALSISVNAPSRTLTYDGNDFVASITDTDSKWEQMFEILPDIQYGYKEFGMEAASYSSVTYTKDAGYYKASITAGEKTAYVEYQILKKDFTDSLMLSIDNYEVDGSPNEPVITGKESDGEITYYYKKKDAADSTYTTTAPTTPWGDYTVKADVAETKNYASASKTCNFQITPKERPTISVTMFGYKYGQDTAPTPYITPSAGELAENPTVTYNYGLYGSSEDRQLWTGDTSALGADTTYDMRAVIGATDSYKEYITNPTQFYVEKGEWKVTAPTAKTGLTYNCIGQNLVDAGSTVGNGKFLYSIDGTNYSESIPQAIDAGTHKVYYKVESDGNHDEYRCDAPIEVTIAKADWNVTAPVAKTQTFTGEEQALIDPGTVKDVNGSDVPYKMEYSLTTEDEDFSTDIPKDGNIGPYTVYYRVKGDKNYNEYATQSVMAAIVPEAGIWCADIPDQVYTGKAIKPAINVYSDGTLLKLGTDYTIAYSNNTKAALSTATNAKGKSIAPTVTITGKGNYKNTKIARTFTIEQYSLDGINGGISAKVDPMTVAYTKKPIKLSPVVTLNGKKLKMGTDYILSTEADGSCEVKTLTEEGPHNLYVVGKGNYSGNIPYTFTITNLVPASKVSIGKIANPKYTGEELEPDVLITYKKENVNNDFTIEYQNNTEIGTATVIITAKPGTEFSGSKSATFKIEGTSIAKAVLGADGKGKIEAYTYSGNPCKPEPDLYIGTKELENGVDYLLSYKSNVNAGTATMTVTGKGAYTGTKKFTFKINKYDAGVDAGGLIKVNNGELISVKYEKGGVTPKVSVSFGGQILEEKKDYTLSYANNKTVADEDAQNAKGKSIAPTITVTFKGNFSGKKLKTFEIANKDIEECTLTVADKAYSTKKNAWKQTTITITDVNGKKLAARTDYDTNVKYYSDPECSKEIAEDTLASGTAIYVKAYGCNNYFGEVVGQYRISKTNISAVKATISQKEYTGKEIKLTASDIIVTIGSGKNLVTLTEGTDYEIVENGYKNNINKGTATVTIRGKDNYFGTKAVKFKIVNKPFEWWE